MSDAKKEAAAKKDGGGSDASAAASEKSKSKAPKSKLTPAQNTKALAAEVAARKAQETKEALADIPHQTLVKSRMLDLRGRNQLLSHTLRDLSDQLSTSTRDSAEVLQYLEAEVRRKDLVTKQLGKELRELNTAQIAEKKSMADKYASEIAEMERTFLQAESELLALNRLRHQEHTDLQLFQRIRGDLMAELAQTKKTILRNEQRHALQMSDLEKKFLAARQRLLAESQARIAASRREYKEEIGRELDLESEWLRRENGNLRSETEFHQVLMEKLRKSNAELQGMAQALEGEVAELEKKDVAYASHSLRNSNILKELTTKHAMLSASLTQIRTELAKNKGKDGPKLLLSSDSGSSTALTAPFQSPSAQQQQLQSDPSLLALQNELDKLAALSAQKARENQALASQIGLYKSQRTNIELWTLEALHQVKVEICARRRRTYEAAMRIHKNDLQTLAQTVYQPRGMKMLLPPEEAKSSPFGSTFVPTSSLQIQSDPRVPEPVAPQMDPSKLTLADFSMHDRERVLQLLFEKLHETNEPTPPAAAVVQERPSTALSLYDSRPASSGSTALVLSRPTSSTRAQPRQPPSSNAKPRSAARSRGPLRPLPSSSSGLLSSDMRPSEYAQMTSMASAAGRGSSGGRARKMQQQRRSVDEKDSSGSKSNMPPFFPPRGDTPTELL
jgi:hypothetical protein